MEYPVHKTVLKVDGKDTYPEIICTCGSDFYNKKPCIGGYMYDHYSGKPNPWRSHFVTKHQLVHFAWYHNVARLDNKGEQVMYQDKAQFNKERCTREECKHCSTGNTPVFGRLMKLTLGTNHTKNLMGFRKTLYWTCSGCGTQIVTKELQCERCSKVLVDLRNVKPTDPKDILGSVRAQIEKAINTEYMCDCGHNGFPVEGNDCGYNAACTSKNRKNHKCPFDAPMRMDLYTSVIDLAKEGEKTDSHLVLKGAYSIYEASNSYVNLESEEPLQLVIERAVENNGGLYNLEKEVKDMVLPVEDQATVLRERNPYSEGPRIPGGEEDRPRFAMGASGVKFGG